MAEPWLDQTKEPSGAWVARPVKGRTGFDLREERGSLPAMGPMTGKDEIGYQKPPRRTPPFSRRRSQDSGDV
jgi:hypothetical protein